MDGKYQHDFSEAVMESGSGGTGGRGGDIGSHNRNTTNNIGDTIVAKGTKAYNYIVSGFKGNSTTIIHSAGNTTNNSINNSVNNSRTNSSIDNSMNTYVGRGVYSYQMSGAEYASKSSKPNDPCAASSSNVSLNARLRQHCELAGYVSPSPKPEESPSMNVNSDPAPEVYNESVTETKLYAPQPSYRLGSLPQLNPSFPFKSDLISQQNTPATTSYSPYSPYSPSSLESESRTKVSSTTSLSHCSDNANDEENTEEKLLNLVHSVNDNIAHISRNIASKIPPHYLEGQRYSEFHMTELNAACIKERCMGTKGLQLIIQSRLNALLFERVFEPFAPGLDPETSNSLMSIYTRLTLAELDYPYSLALWRSMTYSHCRKSFDSLKFSEAIAQEFLFTVQVLIPQWLRCTHLVGFPDIATLYQNELTSVVQDAIALQDLSQTTTQAQSGMYDIVMPKGGTQFNSHVSDRRFLLSRSYTSHIQSSYNVVVGCSALGLSRIKGNTSINMLKSGVIVTDSEAIYNRIYTKDICVY